MMGLIGKTVCFLGVAVCFLCACSQTSRQNEKTAKQEVASDWINLIGEVPGEHWHGYLEDTVAGWEITDGVLSTSGKNGDIVTHDTFTDFELEVEWKINESGNSGIFYYVVETPNYKRISETGPEFQIIDNEGYPQALTEAQKTGALSDVIAPDTAAANPPGEWNHTRIIVQDNHAEHWLNGQLILTYELGSSEWDQAVAASKFADLDYGKTRSGRIGLQDHGDEVFFRNIRIRTL